jgi:hypothetical protein
VVVTKKIVNINIYIVVESLLTLKNILLITSNKDKLYNLYDWLFVSNRLSAFISINSFKWIPRFIKSYIYNILFVVEVDQLLFLEYIFKLKTGFYNSYIIFFNSLSFSKSSK